jgi:hypothetical protein
MANRKSAATSKRAVHSRKPARAQKPVRRPKAAARAQRNKQEFVRSPKGSPPRPVAAGSTELPVEPRGSKPEGPDVENRGAAVQAVLQAALQDGFSQKLRDNHQKKEFEFSLITANGQAYQAKLLEGLQDNVNFAFEFGQKLATTRSPFEFMAVIAEFTGRFIIKAQKHSNEMATFLRLDAFREFTALPGR